MTDNNGRSHPMRRATDAARTPQHGALVVTTRSGERASTARLTRPDSTFVTHLIATAQQSPQTRVLRRAATADVDAAYRAAVSRRLEPATKGGLTIRNA